MFYRGVHDIFFFHFTYVECIYLCRDLDSLNQYMVLLPILLDRLNISFSHIFLSFSVSLLLSNIKGEKKLGCIQCGILWLNMQDKANPLATILSAAMLLKYGLGEEHAAKRIEKAVLDALDKGLRTGDIYSAGTVSILYSWPA